MKLVLVRALLQRKKRRQHRWWVHNLLQKRIEHGVFYHLVKELNLDAERFQQYFHLSREQFAQVLFCIGPYIEKRSRSREVMQMSFIKSYKILVVTTVCNGLLCRFQV